MSKVLITGGAGFIGSYLCEEVLTNGHECHVVDNMFHKTLENLDHVKDKIALHHADITEETQLEKKFKMIRPGFVFHLAAHHYIPYCNKNPVDAISVNISGTQHVVNMCEMFQIEKVFYASTAAVYGISAKPHSESELPDPMDIYGVTKYCGEKILSLFHDRTNISVIIGRLFNAIGKRETNPHVLPEIFRQLGNADFSGELHLGNIHPKRDYIHAGDIAKAAYRTMITAKDKEMDIVNIGSGHELSVGEIVDMVSMLRGKKIGIKIDPEKVRKVDREHLCADTTKLRTKYEFTPETSVRETLRQLLEA